MPVLIIQIDPTKVIISPYDRPYRGGLLMIQVRIV